MSAHRDNAGIPAGRDEARWLADTAELREFLAQARTKPEIEDWALKRYRKTGHGKTWLENALDWLELRGHLVRARPNGGAKALYQLVPQTPATPARDPTPPSAPVTGVVASSVAEYLAQRRAPAAPPAPPPPAPPPATPAEENTMATKNCSACGKRGTLQNRIGPSGLCGDCKGTATTPAAANEAPPRRSRGTGAPHRAQAPELGAHRRPRRQHDPLGVRGARAADRGRGRVAA